MEVNRIKSCFIIALMEAIVLFLPIVSSSDTITLWQLVNCLGYYDVEITKADIVTFVIDSFPYLIFQIIWGTYIYERFCSASVYFFSRKKNKIGWYLSECFKLFLYGVFYLIILLFFGILMSCICRRLEVNNIEIWVMLEFLILFSVFLFAVTLMINVLSIVINSMCGFAIVAGIEFICIAIFGIWSDWMVDFNLLSEMEKTPNILFQLKILKVNPLSHLVMHWHSSVFDQINKTINICGMNFSIEKSILLFTVIAVAIVVFGILVVRKTELIENERE